MGSMCVCCLCGVRVVCVVCEGLILPPKWAWCVIRGKYPGYMQEKKGEEMGNRKQGHIFPSVYDSISDG